MSIKNASNITGAPSEWSRRKRIARRAILATICLAVVATGASLLVLKGSRKSAVVERNPASAAAQIENSRAYDMHASTRATRAGDGGNTKLLTC